ncbi:hypothetical protein UG86_01690 [Staphylococcus aureus]|uniref:Uncharacterized protein n=1 Tax=Staphylococcus phage 80alpha TaxID=53369 RepID=A4ZFD8_BP80A|nr:hypothetical protein SPV-80A_gp72 [Staphylococcus phage 80alpha]AJP64814.1 hypothetical protein UG86_01690 [Staphylococcus aureus]ABF71643.1 hypothetical protein [Staphylococcus phage 80alpha]ALC95796.1 hypothetical protein NB74_14645 [Staphylococcus aureus]KIT67064.1 hypothetical protein PY02_04575 [Staphylococcus aureus]KPM69507.1 hypothetical protein AM595_14095 [Staphylococcus aureus]
MLLRYMYRVMTRKMSPVGPTVRYMASARLYSSLLLYKSNYNIKAPRKLLYGNAKVIYTTGSSMKTMLSIARKNIQ